MSHAATSPSGDRMCPESPTSERRWAAPSPPRDADEESFRRWLATSAWPEVVFASA